jgi:ATP-binding cassette subfamily C protein
MMRRDNNKLDLVALVLRTCRAAFATAAAFSLAINLLYLAAPLYMMQVYDRVISSASATTLVVLTLILLVALAVLAGLDSIRAWLLTRISLRIDRLLAPRVVYAALEAKARNIEFAHLPLRDFDTCRQFITGTGIQALFDAPWSPIYILLIGLLHPALGFFAFASAVLLMFVAVANEYWLRKPLKDTHEAVAANYRFTETSLGNWQAVHAMGILPALLQHWGRERNFALGLQQYTGERSAALSALIRFLRLSFQSLILGLGAYLVIESQLTVGAIFAASLLLGRALQPVEQMVGSWRAFLLARVAYGRVKMLVNAFPIPRAAVILPRPTMQLSVEQVAYVVPGTSRPILHNVSFRVGAGEVLCVVGASGAGKSTLARLLVSVLPPSTGSVRLDHADLREWPRVALGRYLGYLPQDVQLFDATVAQNISRFNEDDGPDVIEAARLAGVHEMILRLPKGYSTSIGESGGLLSGGCRQRIGLARAVYGSPSLVVLDEPSSNLDQAGDVALSDCVARLKERGTIVVLIAHRPETIALADSILVLEHGTTSLFGERENVIRRLSGTGRIREIRTRGLPQ